MSVLETFVRIRRYRTRAADFQRLAGGSVSLDVRDRYLAIANHYIALANAEVLSDKLRRKERLKELRSEREQPQVKVDQEAPPRTPVTIKLRVINSTGKRSASPLSASRRRTRLAAHLSNLVVKKSAP